MQAVPIVEALQQLPRSARALAGEADVMSNMNWPPSLLATSNFLRPSSQRAVVASHVRKADALLLFQDGSALLLSERECEQVTKALRRAAAADVRVLLAHLSYARDMCMPGLDDSNACSGIGPLSIGNHGLVEDPVARQRLLHALAAAQLFNGETGFGGVHACEEDVLSWHKGRVAAVQRLVFGTGDRGCGGELSGREGRDAAHQVIRAREQAPCWPGSTLEALCYKQMSAELVAAQRTAPAWGWVSPGSPFLN